MNARPVGCRDHAIEFDEFVVALRTGCEGENCPPVLLEVNLAEHLSSGRLISDAEDDLIAPVDGVACGLNHMRKRQDKLADPFSIQRVDTEQVPDRSTVDPSWI